MSRKEIVYARIKELNGRVSDQAAWRRIVQDAGYTAYRDAAGFFGGRCPSLVLNADGSRSLTADAGVAPASRLWVAGARASRAPAGRCSVRLRQVILPRRF